MERLRLGFDDHVNYIFYNDLRNKWPQINGATKIQLMSVDEVRFYKNDEPDLKFPVYTDCKKGFKNYIKRSYGALTGNDRIVKETMNHKMSEPVVEKSFRMEEHFYRDFDNTNVLICVYNPEIDTLYKKGHFVYPNKP